MYDILCCIICVFAVYGIYSALRELKTFLLRRSAKAALKSAGRENCTDCTATECSCEHCQGGCCIEIPADDEEY